MRKGVHLCDLSGEATWLRDIIDEHHAQAESTGAKIVPSCGYDSIPAVSNLVGEYSPRKNWMPCDAQSE